MARWVLIIEDDPLLARLLQCFFEREGWQTRKVATVEEALDAYEAGHYGLILSESRIKGEDNRLLIQALSHEGFDSLYISFQLIWSSRVFQRRFGMAMSVDSRAKLLEKRVCL